MVKLDYRTNNPRWGLRGMKFENWESYSFTLGYLSNPNHYNNKHPYGQTCGKYQVTRYYLPLNCEAER